MNMAERMEMGEIDKLEFEKTVDNLLQQNVVVPGMALSIAAGTLFSLLLARWWQALLYKPGGFKEEFHNLRIEPRLVAASAGITFVFMLMPNGGVGILIMVLPIFFAGLGYIHWWAARQKMPFILWVVYLGMFIPLWVGTAVVVIGLFDSFVNLRKRISD